VPNLRSDLLEVMGTVKVPNSVLDFHEVKVWLTAVRSVDEELGDRLALSVLRKAVGFELSATEVEDISVSRLARVCFVFLTQRTPESLLRRILRP